MTVDDLYDWLPKDMARVLMMAWCVATARGRGDVCMVYCHSLRLW